MGPQFVVHICLHMSHAPLAFEKSTANVLLSICLPFCQCPCAARHLSLVATTIYVSAHRIPFEWILCCRSVLLLPLGGISDLLDVDRPYAPRDAMQMCTNQITMGDSKTKQQQHQTQTRIENENQKQNAFRL